MRPSRQLLRTRVCAALLVIGAGGCGLSDYQNRMDTQRTRIQKFDEINNLLDDPIGMPMMQFGVVKEEKPAWPFDVYLRLPRGFSTAPKDKAPYYINFAFFRYSAGDPAYNIFIVAANVAEPKKEQEIGKYHPKYFRDYVRAAIGDYYLKTQKFNLVLPDKVKPSVETVERVSTYPAEDAKPLLFETYEYRDTANTKITEHSVFRAYFHDTLPPDSRQICIVVQRPLRTPNENFDKAIKACLGTLDISGEAAGKRAQFKKARGH
jgi:hypothetical protein